MAFYNEIFVEEENKLVHIGSCCGSDTPHYFQEVKTLKDWDEALIELEKGNGFYLHSDKHPFPWKTYKTSDNLIVLREKPKTWWNPFKPTHDVWVAVDKSKIKDDNKSYFVLADKWGGDIHYSKKDLTILELPILKKVL